MNSTNTPMSNVRGTADILPAECAVRRRILDRLCRTLESFGYQRIEVPVIEHTELFLTKSGEDIISKMYSFPVKNRSICLRPEFTASVGRAFVNHLQDRPLPLRLYYAGPVFRYEKPQKGRYRQFNQVGVELIGAPSPWADAEIVRCACDGMEELGLTSYQVVMGHIGVVTELLRVFELDRQAHMFLIQNMENLWKNGKGVEHVKARLREVYPDFDRESGWSALTESVSAHSDEVDSDMLRLFGEMNEEDARSLLRDILSRFEIGIGLGNREPEEVVDRLLRKIRHRDMSAKISQAIDFLSQLNELSGPPPVALSGIRDLLVEHDVGCDALDELERLIEAMDVHDIDLDRITLNLGMGRGLQYYTGMIFEIYHDTISTETQVCGGGRYDDLIQALGGHRPVSACGFSYGLERLRLALDHRSEGTTTQVLVLAVADSDREETVRVARKLRGLGLRVESDVRGRSVKGNLKYADRSGIPFCIIVGSMERESGHVLVRDMGKKEESTIPCDDLGAFVKQIEGCTTS